MERLRPELVEGIEEARRELENEVSKHLTRAVDFVRSSSRPTEWLEDVRVLEQSASDEGSVPGEANERAWTALEELDAEELLACAVERLEPSFGEELHEALLPRVRWVAQRAELFLGVAPRVSALGEAVRPDLDEVHPDLAVTVIKYARILDALEDFHRHSALETLPALTPEAARAFLNEIRRGRKRLLERLVEQGKRISDEIRQKVFRIPSLPSFEPTVATGTGEGAVREGPLFRWRGPEGEWEAMMRLPPPAEAADDEIVTLVVDGASRGSTVILKGLFRSLVPDGAYLSASFTMLELREVWDREDAPSLALVGPSEASEPELGVPI